MLGNIFHFFDKFEDHNRRVLSHYPITYALIGALGIILLWKGVWDVSGTIPLLSGIGSIVVGLTLLLSTGLLVSFFVGEGIIISGIKGEKKLVEKTEQEVRTEEETIEYLVAQVERISEQVEILEHTLSRHR